MSNSEQKNFQEQFEQQLKIMRFFESLIVFAFNSVMNTIVYISSLMLFTFTTFLLSLALCFISLQAAASVFNFLMLTLFVIAHLNPVFLIISLSIILLASLAMTYMFLKEPEKNTASTLQKAGEVEETATAKSAQQEKTATAESDQKENSLLEKLYNLTTSFFAKQDKASSEIEMKAPRNGYNA